MLGKREGLGDLASAVETAASTYIIPGVQSDSIVGCQYSKESPPKDSAVDWKRAYHGLSRVMHQIKDLVVKATKAAEQKEIQDARAMFNPTSAAIRSKYSLREMLQIRKCVIISFFSVVNYHTGLIRWFKFMCVPNISLNLVCQFNINFSFLL